MSLQIIADVILFFHFLIIIFIVSLFFVVPVGYKLNWQWQKNEKLRLLHLVLITIVTFESIIGITCPLTFIENNLRGIHISNSFISIWLTKIVFWQLPSIFFLIIYSLCLFWTILMWIKFPPKK